MAKNGFEIPSNILRLIAVLTDKDAELTPEQQIMLDSWSDESQANRQLFESLQELWQASALSEPPALSEDVILEMMDKLESNKTLSDPSEQPLAIFSSNKKDVSAVPVSREIGHSQSRESQWALWTLRAAALLVLSVGIFWLSQWLKGDRLQQQPLPYQEFTTANAQKLQIRLSDGSLIYLNSASQLRVWTAFSDSYRKVFLRGEAYFEVPPGSTPFVVETKLGKIKDIGTEFNVKMRLSQLQVVVAEGQVLFYPDTDNEEVSKRSQPPSNPPRLQVSSGQMVGYSAQGQLELAYQVDVERFLAWKKNILIFERTPLNEVLQELTRQFDLEFKITTDLEGRSLTAKLNNLTQDKALEKLSLITGLKVERNGKVVYVSENK